MYGGAAYQPASRAARREADECERLALKRVGLAAMKAMKVAPMKGMKRKPEKDEEEDDEESESEEQPMKAMKAKKGMKSMKAMKTMKAMKAMKKKPQCRQTCWDLARHARRATTNGLTSPAPTLAYEDEGVEKEQVKKTETKPADDEVTRAMRYIFEKFQHKLVSQEDRLEYERLQGLKGKGVRGIQAKRDEIVAKYVPPTNSYQDGFKPEYAASKEKEASWEDRQTAQCSGLDPLMALWTIFHGNEAAMQKCILAKVLWEGSDGLLYWKSKSHSKSYTDATKIAGVEKLSVENAKDLCHVLQNMHNEMAEVGPIDEIFDKVQNVLNRPAIEDAAPTDDNMVVLQA